MKAKSGEYLFIRNQYAVHMNRRNTETVSIMDELLSTILFIKKMAVEQQKAVHMMTKHSTGSYVGK